MTIPMPAGACYTQDPDTNDGIDQTGSCLCQVTQRGPATVITVVLLMSICGARWGS